MQEEERIVDVFVIAHITERSIFLMERYRWVAHVQPTHLGYFCLLPPYYCCGLRLFGTHQGTQSLRRQYVVLVFLLRVQFLRRVLFPLTVSTPDTLGGQALFTKGRPGFEIFATLAPLDFEAVLGHHDPNGHVAGRAHTLVLARNNVNIIVVVGRLGFVAPLGGFGTETELATHDAMALAFGIGCPTVPTRAGLSAAEIVGKVDETGKVGEFAVNVLVGFAVDGIQIIIILKNKEAKANKPVSPSSTTR